MVLREIGLRRSRPQRYVAAVAVVLACVSVDAAAQGAPKARPGAASANQGSSVTGTPNALQGFSQNRDQPIHIDAAKLEVRDKDKIATFSGDSKTGDVKVVQGDTIMRSRVLVVYYDQQTPGAAPAKSSKSAPAATPGPGGSQQIRRLEAKGNVIVSQKDQTVTGDSGIFDTKANTVTMRGNVVMTQGKNVMQGETLVVDLTTGVSRLETGNGRVQGLFFSGGGGPGGDASKSGAGGKPMILNGLGGSPGR